MAPGFIDTAMTSTLSEEFKQTALKVIPLGRVGATDDQVTVAADEGVVSIPYRDINRSNLVEE